MAAVLLPAPTIVEEQWVQCENPNCNKWRKLPPGAKPPPDDEPFFCYLNPDPQRNTCSASEAEYDEKTEMTLDPEDEEHNRQVRQRLQAGIEAAAAAAAAATAATMRGRGRGRGGRGGGRGRGRGRGRGGKAGGGAATSALAQPPAGWLPPALPAVLPPAALPRAAEEDLGALASGRGRAIGRKQQSKHFQRLLENSGSWEGGRGAAAATMALPPPEAWESLAQHAGAELTDAACQACDLASAGSYFEGAGPGGAAAAEGSASMARLALMLASAAGLSATCDVLTEEERQRFGLDAGGAPLVPAAPPGPSSVSPASASPAAAATAAGGSPGAQLRQQVQAQLQQQQQQQVQVQSEICEAYQAAAMCNRPYIAQACKKTGQAYLSGNFAPVHDERLDEGLAVVGKLPASLEGTFLRIGPNAVLPPIHGKKGPRRRRDAPACGAGRLARASRGGGLSCYHLFDGDRHVHAVRCFPATNTATYSNHQVQTARLRQEREAGMPLVPKFGDYMGLRGLAIILLDRLARRLGLLDASGGLGAANTALVHHGGKLLALHEGDLPYQLALPPGGGPISTVGRERLGGAWQRAFTAHPKLDPATGELFFFGYSVEQAPYCWVGRLSPAGEVERQFAVPLREPVMMHDCGLTENHLVLLDAMVKRGGLPFVFRKRAARFGLVPRDATSAAAVRWFETEPLMAFHVANAWEEGSKVHLVLCTFEEFSLDLETPPGVVRPLPYLTEVVMDLESGGAAMRRVCDVPGDFPQASRGRWCSRAVAVAPAALVGRRTRYVYHAQLTPTPTGEPVFPALVKTDLQTGQVWVVEHGPGRLGGEAIFVPDPSRQGEDAGHLVTFVHNELLGVSELVIYDAQAMSPEPVARVPLRRRVPYGFHAAWVAADAPRG
eukprot:scaffold20.g7809.t1